MIRLLVTYLRPYRAQVALVVVLVSIQATANLYLPNLNADIINNGVVKGDIGYIVRTGALMLGVTLLMGIASVIAVYFSSRTAMAFGRDVRGEVFRKVLSFSQVETNRFGAPSLITRNTNDVTQVQMVIALALNVMILAPIMSVGGVVMALREDVPLSSLLLVIIPLMLAVIGSLVYRAMPLFRAMQVKIDRINQLMRENLAGIRVIRAFVRTEHEERRFEEANLDLTRTALRVNRLFALMIPSLFLILNMSLVAILWFGGQRIDSGEMPIGNLLAFLQYVMQILFAVMMATIMFVMVPRAAASAERIAQVLDTDVSLADPESPVLAPPARGRVEFRDVEFRYPGAEAPVLCDVSFTAEPGRTTAIVGSTGAGKSTLVNLIPRLYDVSGGSVLVDGVDVRAMSQEDLWARVGLVPQRAFLFSGTVGSNLRYGDASATDDELWAALDVAQGREFVSEMPGGLEAPIDQGGTNVSGGQRQRLAIARALVKRPAICIFDDSFSALDFRTDSLLRAALREETADATVIIVAQRVGTIMHADQIVVLEAGEVAGVGTHAELMETCETYREIVFSQLSAEEAA
ncbi:MAG TPA: ABC transporter ATP-binding protein [Candidatus Dormibacteraeota bacterium]|nr:ABC transporter ATP-binding protein [Candidatus Dormibacteraeota bacterium]